MPKKILYTPSEIVERNPVLSRVWNAADIGYLYKLKLVNGVKTSRKVFIDEDEVLRVFYFVMPKQAAAAAPPPC